MDWSMRMVPHILWEEEPASVETASREEELFSLETSAPPTYP